LGSSLSTRKGFERLVEVFNQKYKGCKNNYGIDGGDMIEAIAVDDKRFNEDMLNQPLPLEQADQAIKDREPIKKKLIAILNGNHEDKLWKFGNLAEYIANKLGVTYGTYTVKLSVLDKSGKLMYKLYDTHGRKGISSSADDPIRVQANMELSLKRHLRYQAGDCAVMVKGHCHKLLVCKPREELYITDNGTKLQQNYTSWGQNEPYIHQDARWYGATGSFLRLFGEGISGYAEKAEYSPTELGFLILVVRDRQIVSLDKYVLDV
jgi:hypothetical protein